MNGYKFNMASVFSLSKFRLYTYFPNRLIYKPACFYYVTISRIQKLGYVASLKRDDYQRDDPFGYNHKIAEYTCACSDLLYNTCRLL